jgi:hypothetical protein
LFIFKHIPCFYYVGDFPQPRVAAQVLGVLLLNIKLADYSIRDETMDEVLTQFSNVSSKLTILMEAAIKNPKVTKV